MSPAPCLHVKDVAARLRVDAGRVLNWIKSGRLLAIDVSEGNALQLAEWRKRGLEYDPKVNESLVTRMIDVCTSDYFSRVCGFGLESELPVFVVGLPRSGTTLVEQILASHSRVFGAGRDPFHQRFHGRAR